MTQWLLAKLNAKSTNKIIIINSNNDFYQKLWHYNIILYEKYSELENPDIIIIFCNNMSELQLKMSEYITNIKKNNSEHILRICYPKFTTPQASDINRDKMRKYMIEKHNMTWVKMIALDDIYLAMRFKFIYNLSTK